VLTVTLSLSLSLSWLLETYTHHMEPSRTRHTLPYTVFWHSLKSSYTDTGMALSMVLGEENVCSARIYAFVPALQIYTFSISGTRYKKFRIPSMVQSFLSYTILPCCSHKGKRCRLWKRDLKVRSTYTVWGVTILKPSSIYHSI
jgi:hypothetical protein